MVGIKLIVAGSREVESYDVVYEAVNSALYLWKREWAHVDEVISGTARGVDKLGEEWAYNHEVDIVRFPADWDKYGKSAGYRRNAEMAKYGTHLVAVWDGKSKGTQHMFNLMRNEKKPVYIHLV